MDAYEIMTPEEQAQTKEILFKKGPTIQKLEIPKQARVRERFLKLVGKAPPLKNPKIPSPKWLETYKANKAKAAAAPAP